MKMLVSVIVLTYQNINMLEKNLKSVFGQKYDNIEVIIHDDGSTDFCEEDIFSRFSVRPSNIVNFVVRSNYYNVGTVINYNNALDIANGDIVIPLACDDTFYDEYVITRIVNYFKKTNCNVCTAYYKKQISGLRYPEIKDVKLLKRNNQEELEERLFYSNFISGAVLYWKRSYLMQFGKFDTSFKLVEDYPAIMKLVNTGEKIGFLDAITVLKSEEGISSRKKILTNSNAIAKADAKRIKDIFVMPFLYKLNSKKKKRLVKACYDIKFSEKSKLAFIQYMDIWLEIGIAYMIDRYIKKTPFDVTHIL